MPKCQQDFVDRRIHKTFNLFALSIFFRHLIPVEIHNACENVRVKLGVFDVAEVFGQCLSGQRLGLSLAAFVPATPPTFDVFSLVYPWLFHSVNCIDAFGCHRHWRRAKLGRVVSFRRQAVTKQIHLGYIPLSYNNL